MTSLVQPYVDAVDRFDLLDGAAAAARAAFTKVVPGGAVKDLLSGTVLGHPLHPLLTDLPIGCWTSAVFLDYVGGKRSRDAAQRLIGLGLLSAVPTMLAGASDGVDVDEKDQRVVAVHAVANTMATALFALSWNQRRHARYGRAKLTALAASTVATAAATLGGELTLRRGVGVDETAFTEGVTDWTEATPEAATAHGELRTAHARDVTVAFAEGASRGLDDHCTHRGGPLHEGSVEGNCVRCPWHGSEFSLDDGSVRRGPAVAPAPVYDVRTGDGGRIELRRRAR